MDRLPRHLLKEARLMARDVYSDILWHRVPAPLMSPNWFRAVHDRHQRADEQQVLERLKEPKGRERLRFKPVYIGIPSVILRAVHSLCIDSLSSLSSSTDCLVKPFYLLSIGLSTTFPPEQFRFDSPMADFFQSDLRSHSRSSAFLASLTAPKWTWRKSRFRTICN